MNGNFSNEIKYFLYCSMCALKGEKALPPKFEVDWEEFIKLAKKQESYSLVAASVPYEALDDEYKEQLNNHSKSELFRIIARNNELNNIKAALDENGIKYMLLKGSRIKDFYPKESMRQMSDIDILYDFSRRKELYEIMKDNGYSLHLDSGNSDDFDKPPFYTFEFHYKLFKDVYGFMPDFSNVWENAKKAEGDSYEYLMSDEDIYLHSIAHMYKHYLFGGFGIRFVFDTYVIIKACSQSWDDDYINSRLEEMKLVDFEKNIKELAFAIVEETELNEDMTSLLSNIFDVGLFAHGSEDMQAIYNRYQQNSNNAGKLSYFMSRLFPPKEKMFADYINLREKPYLLPAYYIFRLFKGAAKKDLTIKEIKSINEIDKK